MSPHPEATLTERLPLWPGQHEDIAYLDRYALPDTPTQPAPAVLLIPGGGYGSVSLEREGSWLAGHFIERGYQTFMLHYRVAPHHFPAPVADGQRAMRLLRANAATWALDGQDITTLGFSAGGHLNSLLATQPELDTGEGDDLKGLHPVRPNRAGLAYPVISFVQYTHFGSVQNLFGPNNFHANYDRRRAFSSEFHVTADCPPVFLFHTGMDKGVPPENSLLFAQACVAAGVPCDLHLYHPGGHGVNFAADHPVLSAWPGLFLRWIEQTPAKPATV